MTTPMLKQLGGASLRVFGGSLAITLGVGLGLFARWEIGDLAWDWSPGSGPDNPWVAMRLLARLIGGPP